MPLPRAARQSDGDYAVQPETHAGPTERPAAVILAPDRPDPRRGRAVAVVIPADARSAPSTAAAMPAIPVVPAAPPPRSMPAYPYQPNLYPD